MADDNDDLLAAGKEQGEIMAAYLVDRMTKGKLSPAEAVDVVATHVEQQAEEMLAAGTSRQGILVWLKGVRETMMERLAPLEEPQH